MKNAIALVFVCLFVFVGFACTASSDGVDYPPPQTDSGVSPVPTGEVCRLTTDCRPGESCVAGRCTTPTPPAPGCRANLDCGADRPYCDRETTRCVACTVVESREWPGAFIDQGCARGEECHDGDCVAVDMTCTSEARAARGEECAPNRPHCSLGECVQCLSASQCPRYGDPAYAVVCTEAGLCAASLVGACTASADCDDGDPCTEDKCTGTCGHEAISGCTPPPPPPPADWLNLTWSPPGDYWDATMSAKVNSGPMTERCSGWGPDALTCVLSGLRSGDVVDVSVEYWAGSSPSWSCLGNGAAGRPNGSLVGLVPSGTLPSPAPVTNGIGGCNLRFIYP